MDQKMLTPCITEGFWVLSKFLNTVEPHWFEPCYNSKTSLGKIISVSLGKPLYFEVNIN